MVLKFGGQRKYYRMRWWILFQNDGISNVYKTLKIKYEFFSLKRVTMLQISMFPKEIKQKKRNVDSDNRFEYLQKKNNVNLGTNYWVGCE